MATQIVSSNKLIINGTRKSMSKERTIINTTSKQNHKYLWNNLIERERERERETLKLKL